MLKRRVFEPAHVGHREEVARFLEQEVAPHYAAWEERGIIPRAAWERAGEAGLLCGTVPKEYGGRGADFLRSVIVIEEIAKRRFGGFMTYLHSDIVVPYILRFGSEAQKRRYLPECVAGRMLTAVALTEPHSGSDIEAMRTSAESEGDAYRINGTKTHVSCGMNADLIVVAARTSGDGREGISLLLVEATDAGLTRAPIPNAGLRALDTATLEFVTCRVPMSRLLGSKGMGFVYLMKMLSLERLVLAIAAQAACVQILQETVVACAARATRAGSVLDYQNTRFVLADLLSECEANQAFVDRCIADHLRGETFADAACMAKLRTTELLKRLALHAMQLRGARGVMRGEGNRAGQDLLDACVQTVWGGPSEVMKSMIATGLEKLA